MHRCLLGVLSLSILLASCDSDGDASSRDAGEDSGTTGSDAGEDSGTTGSDAGEGDGGSAQNFGDLEGTPFLVQGSHASFHEVPGDRGYVSISITSQPETCDTGPVCDEARLNFTLYAIGGTLADVEPGTYEVGSHEQGSITYELVGAAGWYDDACTTGGGFDSLASGTVTLTQVSGGRVKGEVDFTLETAETLTGTFDALDCTDAS